MSRFRTTALMSIAALVLLAAHPAAGQTGANLQLAQADDTPADGSVPRPRRVRTRVEVRPVGPMHRECEARLVQEFRPSGTVVVPRMHCWWAR